MQRSFHLELIKPYLNKYFEVFPEYVVAKERNYSEVFGNYFSPAFLGREEDIAKFKSMIEKAPEDKPFYQIILKKQVETIEVIQKAKALCGSQN